MGRSVRYARAGEINIAYQIVGDGPRDLVFLPGWVSHLELAWEDPHLAYFYSRLSSMVRLIIFDKRGTGLSDPAPGSHTLEERLDDIRAVMAAAGSERATLFGVSGGGTMAVAYAAREPGRVEALILHSAVARLVSVDDYPWGWDREFFTVVVDSMIESWGDPRVPGIEFINPSVAADARYRDWLGRYMRSAASPAMVKDLMWSDAELDVRDDLRRIDVPALVTCRHDETWVSPEQSRYIARELPRSELVEAAGSDHWPWVGNADEILDAVEGFLTGKRPRRRAAAHQIGMEALSRRQREVVRLAIHGLPASEIAADLKIGERTVETHLANAYRKLGVRSRLELLRNYGQMPS